MTKATRPVKRETYSSIREKGSARPLIIEVHATHVVIRPKGCRYAFTVTYDQIWTIGAKNAAEAKRLERKAIRKGAAK